MQYTNFPGTNEQVSVIGLGTWVFGGENWGGAKDAESLAAVEKAIELGMNFIDTAPFYGDGLAEKLVGQVISKKRDKVFIATKCGLIRSAGRVSHDLTPASIAREVDLSRSRLQADVIDLYQCHWPDPKTPVEKTMDALLKLKSEGKVRHIGVSNFDLELLKRAAAVAPVATLQIQYSLLERTIEKEFLPFCVEKGIGVITYGSMAGGVLSGKYKTAPQFGKWDARKMFYRFFEGGKFQETAKRVERLRSLGRPLNQLALNWVRRQKGVLTTLAGCRNAGQTASNAAAAEWDLSAEELGKVKNILDKGDQIMAEQKIRIEKVDNNALKALGVFGWPIWEKEVSAFDWHYDEKEVCLFLEGEVTVKTPFETVSFGKGDLVTFPAGLSCTWHVTHPVRKHYKFGA